jgi:hypothetical protein
MRALRSHLRRGLFYREVGKVLLPLTEILFNAEIDIMNVLLLALF